jgi:hypothetical protein
MTHELIQALEDVAAYFAALDEMQPDRNHGTEGARIRAVVQAAIESAQDDYSDCCDRGGSYFVPHEL